MTLPMPFDPPGAVELTVVNGLVQRELLTSHEDMSTG